MSTQEQPKHGIVGKPTEHSVDNMVGGLNCRGKIVGEGNLEILQLFRQSLEMW